MSKNANYYDDVRDQLDAIADKLDPDNTTDKSANYNDAIVESLTRIADNFETGGGFPEVFVYSGYIVKEPNKSGTANRYTRKEFNDLLDKYGMVWMKTTLSNSESYDYYAITFIWKPSTGNASAVCIPQGFLGLGYATLTTSGTQTSYVSSPLWNCKEAPLPIYPSVTGTYKLVCEVGEYGDVAMNWVADTSGDSTGDPDPGGGGLDF